MGRVGWVDASSGASGDMLLGALHGVLSGLGLDPDVMRRSAAAVVPVDIEVTREQRGGFAVARANVRTAETDPPHRTWAEIQDLLERASLPSTTKSLALQTFQRLAEAEATVHGVTSDQIHFHEVGAHDSIADIVGVCAGYAALDLDALYVSTIALGGGHATTSHGPIPVPGPAVLELLRHSDLDAHGGPADEELCTPTGAALLTTLAVATRPMPAMTVQAVGLGAGSRHTGVGLSALRLVVGSAAPLVTGSAAAAPDAAPNDAAPDAAAPDAAAGVVIETNVDDLDPRLWPGVIQRLLDVGASDAWLTPILMKKGRPAHTLHVLVGADPLVREQVRHVVLTETTAIGLRETPVTKTALGRRDEVVHVRGQSVRVKVASDAEGHVVNVQPEYEDLATAARTLGVPVKQVLAEALAAAQERSTRTP